MKLSEIITREFPRHSQARIAQSLDIAKATVHHILRHDRLSPSTARILMARFPQHTESCQAELDAYHRKMSECADMRRNIRSNLYGHLPPLVPSDVTCYAMPMIFKQPEIAGYWA